MNPSYEYIFDSYCKRVLRNAANDYYAELSRRQSHEVPLEHDSTPPIATRDEYFYENYVFRVFDAGVAICNPDLLDALYSLSDTSRLIVLAVHCVGMSDREVADRLDLVRRTVAYRRQQALRSLRRYLSHV